MERARTPPFGETAERGGKGGGKSPADKLRYQMKSSEKQVRKQRSKRPHPKTKSKGGSFFKESGNRFYFPLFIVFLFPLSLFLSAIVFIGFITIPLRSPLHFLLFTFGNICLLCLRRSGVYSLPSTICRVIAVDAGRFHLVPSSFRRSTRLSSFSPLPALFDIAGAFLISGVRTDFSRRPIASAGIIFGFFNPLLSPTFSSSLPPLSVCFWRHTGRGG